MKTTLVDETTLNTGETNANHERCNTSILCALNVHCHLTQKNSSATVSMQQVCKDAVSATNSKVSQVTVLCRKSDKLFHTECCRTSDSIPSFDVQPPQILTVETDYTFHSAVVALHQTWSCVESAPWALRHGRTSPKTYVTQVLQQPTENHQQN